MRSGRLCCISLLGWMLLASSAAGDAACTSGLPAWAGAAEAPGASEAHCSRYFTAAQTTDDAKRVIYTTAYQCLSSVVGKFGVDVPVPDWETGKSRTAEDFDPLALTDLVMLFVDLPGEAKQLAAACVEPLATEVGTLNGLDPAQRALFKDALDTVFAVGSPAEWIRFGSNYLQPPETEYKPTAFEQIFLNRDLVRSQRVRSSVEWLERISSSCDDGSGSYKQGDERGVSAGKVAGEKAYLQSVLQSGFATAREAYASAEEYARCLALYGSRVQPPTDPRAFAYTQMAGQKDWASMQTAAARENVRRTRDDLCLVADEIRKIDPLFDRAGETAARAREQNAEYDQKIEQLIANLRNCREDDDETEGLRRSLYALTGERCVHHSASEINRLYEQYGRSELGERNRLLDKAKGALDTCSADVEDEIREVAAHLQATQRACDGERDAKLLDGLRQRYQDEVVASEEILEEFKSELGQLESRIFDADCGFDEAESAVASMQERMNAIPRSCQRRIGNAYVRRLGFTRSRMDDFQHNLNRELESIEATALADSAERLSQRIESLAGSGGEASCSEIAELDGEISQLIPPSHVQFTFGRNQDERRRARVSLSTCPLAERVHEAYASQRESLRGRLDALGTPFSEPRALEMADAAWADCDLGGMQRHLEQAAAALESVPSCDAAMRARMDGRLTDLRRKESDLARGLAEYESAVTEASIGAERALATCEFEAIERPRPERLCFEQGLSDAGRSRLDRIAEIERDVERVKTARAGLERAIGDMPTLIDLCRFEGAGVADDFWRGADHAQKLREFEPACISKSPSLAFYDSLRVDAERRWANLKASREHLRKRLDAEVVRDRERARGWRGPATVEEVETLRDGLRRAEEARLTILAQAEPRECYESLLPDIEAEAVPIALPEVAEKPIPEEPAAGSGGWGRGRVQRSPSTPSGEGEPEPPDDPCSGVNVDSALRRADLAASDGDVEAWKNAILPLLSQGCRDPRIMEEVQQASTLAENPDDAVADAVARGRPDLGRAPARNGGGFAEVATGILTEVLAARNRGGSQRTRVPAGDSITQSVYEGIFADGGGSETGRGATSAEPGSTSASDSEGGTTCGIVNWNLSHSADPGSPLAYLVHSNTAGDQHAFGVITVPTLVTYDGKVRCRGALDCLDTVSSAFRDNQGPTQLREYASQREAQQAVSRACPDPSYQSSH